MKAIEKAIPKEESSCVDFPHKIGCGLVGGNWSAYQRIIYGLATRKPSWKLFIWELEQPPRDPRGAPTKCDPYDHDEARSHDLQTEAGCPASNASSDGPQGTDDDPCQSHCSNGAWTKGDNVITYRARKRSTMIDPNSVKSMVERLPKGHEWTGRRWTFIKFKDGHRTTITDNFKTAASDQAMHKFNGHGKWNGKVICEHALPSSEDSLQCSHQPAMPSSEVTDHCVTIYHTRYRKTKSTPRECPDAPPGSGSLRWREDYRGNISRRVRREITRPWLDQQCP